MVVYGSVMLLTKDGFDSVWQCKASYRGWL